MLHDRHENACSMNPHLRKERWDGLQIFHIDDMTTQDVPNTRVKTMIDGIEAPRFPFSGTAELASKLFTAWIPELGKHCNDSGVLYSVDSVVFVKLFAAD